MKLLSGRRISDATVRAAGRILGKSRALRATACVRKTTRRRGRDVARGFVHVPRCKTAFR